jgi:hypothetical protein
MDGGRASTTIFGRWGGEGRTRMGDIVTTMRRVYLVAWYDPEEDEADSENEVYERLRDALAAAAELGSAYPGYWVQVVEVVLDPKEGWEDAHALALE